METREGVHIEAKYVTLHLIGIRLIFREGRYDGWYHYRLKKVP